MKTKLEIQEAIDLLPDGFPGIPESLIAARIALQWVMGVKDEGTYFFEQDLLENRTKVAKRN